MRRRNNMHGLLLLADGFEDTEALTTRDVLIRSGLIITCASIKDDPLVTSSHGISFSINNKLLKDLNLNDYDFLILPGGGRGTQNLLASKLVEQAVHHFMGKHQLVSAICAAPMVLAKYGYLHGKKFTCYRGCEEGLDGIYTGEKVEHVDNIITGRSMLASVDFALEIIETLQGKTQREKIYDQINGKY